MKIIKTLLISTTLIISSLIGAHAESTLDKIMKTGTLKVGTTGDFPGWSFKNPATNEYEGFDIDVAKAFAADMGVELEFVPDIVMPSIGGARRAILAALKDAKMNPEEIGYINAHGTGTVANDKTEASAIKEVFKDHTKKLMVSSTKSMHGHLIGGTGAVELIACIAALKDGMIAPTVGYEKADPNCDLDIIPNLPTTCSYKL